MSAPRMLPLAGAALALAAILGLASCDGVFVEPAGAGRAAVSVSFSMNAAAGADATAFDRADAVRVRLQRRNGGALVADQSLSLTPNGTGREVTIEIELQEDPEVFDLTVQLSAGGQQLFAGTSAITVRQGQTTDAEIPLQAVVASLSLSQSSVTLTAINQTLGIQAYTLFASGDTVRSPNVAWVSQNTGIATVNSAGLVTARAEGQTQITATAGTQSAAVQVRVQAIVASVSVTPAADTLIVAEEMNLTAVARDANGNALSRTPLWVSSAPAVASVDASGRVRALAPGTTTVSATVEGKTGSSVIRVIQAPVSSVTVAPASATVPVGGSVQLRAEARTASGEIVSRPTTWSSGNNAVASVDATGVVVGNAPGTATITATVENASGTAQVTVTGYPDLWISSGTPAPNPTVVTAGASVTMPAWSVANRGNAAASPFASGFYLSADPNITTADTFLGDAAPDGSGLAAGATSNKTQQALTIPAATPAGSYWIGMLVDRAGTVQESDESNNFAAAPLSVVVPVLTVSPSTLAFTAAQGGSNPASQTFTVGNSGAGTLVWSVSDDAAWLTVSPSAGTNAGTVTVSANTTNLAAGSYTATITVSGNASNSPRTVSVTLNVSAVPVIAVNPTSLRFSGLQGVSDPMTQTLAIDNAGGGTLGWSVSKDANWLSVSPSSGTNAGTVTVTASTAGLSVGTYSATITISGNATNSPRTVPVTLTVSPGPTIGVTPTSLTFNAEENGPNPANQTLTVSNTGGGTLTWSISDNAAWLTLAPLSGTNTGTVTATVDKTGLKAGSYSATITITGNSLNSPRTVAVGLTVAYSVPVAPASLTATGVSSTQINLTWSDRANNETGFRIERCTGTIATCTTFTEIATVGANVTSFQNTGLAPATWYTYRVRAYGPGGNSAYSNTAAAVTGAGVAPVLSGGSYSVFRIGDSRCSLYGPTRLGTSFLITFSFTDADGDVPLSTSAINGTWVFYPSGASGTVPGTYPTSPSISGTGAAGTVTTYQCYVFGSDQYVDVTMNLRDGAGNLGQLSPIRIPKPAGAN